VPDACVVLPGVLADGTEVDAWPIIQREAYPDTAAVLAAAAWPAEPYTVHPIGQTGGQLRTGSCIVRTVLSALPPIPAGPLASLSDADHDERSNPATRRQSVQLQLQLQRTNRCRRLCYAGRSVGAIH